MVEPVVPYLDPWNQPLSQRLACLAQGKKRIAYFYEEANNSTFRYRAYNMVQVLNNQPEEGVSAGFFFLEDYSYFDEIADYADVLVICRSRYNAALSHLISKFRARRRKVLFDVDDLVFDPRYTRLVVSTLGLNTYDDHVWDEWFAVVGRLAATLQLCDGAITTNTFLAQRITEFSGLESSVVPNFLNREQLELSDRIFERRARQGFRSGSDRLTLGYFSGSPSHRLDYAIVESALAELMQKRANVDVCVVGYIEPTGALAPFASRIKRVPFQDYVNLQSVIASVDFNLMPLQSNVFTDCKSELKFFDAAAVGTLSIASPTHTYRAVIEHGANSYLARAHEWSSVIAQAIDFMPQYGAMALAARQLVDERFTWKTQHSAILAALGI